MEASSVFWDQPIQIAGPKGASSFSQRFSFRIVENRGSGADGILFVVGPSPDTVWQRRGTALRRHQELHRSRVRHLGQRPPRRPNGNHVGINVGGSVDSIATTIPTGSLKNGNVWTGWDDHDGPSHRLEVRASDTEQRPEQPLVAATVDIPAEIGKNDGYFGLTAALGAASQTIDVPSWNRAGVFTDVEPPRPDPVSQPVADAGPDRSVEEGTSVTLDGSASKAGAEPAGDLTSSWRQVSRDGPPVFLSSRTSAHPPSSRPTTAAMSSS